MDDNWINWDYASRYAEIKEGLSSPRKDSVADAERRLAVETRDEGTLAGFLTTTMPTALMKIQSFVTSGHVDEAKKLYDDLNGTINANIDGIGSLAVSRGRGALTAGIIDQAQRAIRYGFNTDTEVTTPTGETYRLGQYFNDDRIWKNPGRTYTNRGFSSRTVDALLNSDDDQLRQSLGVLMNNSDQVTFAGAGNRADIDRARLQDSEAANAFLDNYETIRGVFGDGVVDFAQHINSTHRSAGDAKRMILTLTDFARNYSDRTGVTGGRLVSDVVSAYSRFTAGANVSDGGIREIDPDSRMLGDSVITRVLSKMTKDTGTGFLDFLDDESAQYAMRENLDILADARAYGVDLLGVMANGGRSLTDDMANHVLNARGDIGGSTTIRNIREFTQSMQSRITGGRDFTPYADQGMSADPSDRRRVRRYTKGSSSSPDSDVLARDISVSLYRTFVPVMASQGVDANTAWEYIQSDPELVQSLLADLTGSIAKTFSGRGRAAAAQRTAEAALAAFTSGRSFNVEDFIGQMATARADTTFTTPEARETFSNWYYGHTRADEQYSDQLKQLQLHLMSPSGGGLDEVSAARTVSAMKSHLSELVRMREAGISSIDPGSVIDDALDSGFLYREVETTDPATGAASRIIVKTPVVSGLQSRFTDPQFAPGQADLAARFQDQERIRSHVASQVSTAAALKGLQGESEGAEQ